MKNQNQNKIHMKAEGKSESQMKRCKKCINATKSLFLYCGCLGIGWTLVIVCIINLSFAFYISYLLWVLEESSWPPLLGFSWTSQVRMCLLPEVCISGGLSAFLMYGTLARKTMGLFVAIVCQWLLIAGCFIFGTLYTINYNMIPAYFMVLLWSYFLVRSYILFLTTILYYRWKGVDFISKQDVTELYVTTT